MTIEDEVLNILLIEDNEGDMILLEERLKLGHTPFVIEWYEDGEIALEALENNKLQPHLIILDINLPKLTGLEILQKIKQDTILKNTPVIMLTSSQYMQDMETAQSLGANGYMNKPCDVDVHDLVSFCSLVKNNPSTWMPLGKN